MLLFLLLTAHRSLPVSDPWLVSPSDDSSFPLSSPIPVIFPHSRISKLLQRHSQDELICQIDTSFVEVYDLSRDVSNAQILIPTDSLLPGPHTLKTGLRSPDGVYHWKDSRTIHLLPPPFRDPPAAPPLTELHAPGPLAKPALSIEIVTSFVGKLVPAQLRHVVATVKVSYSGSDPVTVQGRLNCDNASDTWFDIARGIAIGEPVAITLPVDVFRNLAIYPRIVWFDLQASAEAGYRSKVIGGAFELLIPERPTLDLVAPASHRFPAIVMDDVQDQSAIFSISGTLLVRLYLEYAFGFDPTNWIRLKTVAPGPDVLVKIPASVWTDDNERALRARSSSLRFRVSDGWTVSNDRVEISYGTISSDDPVPIAPTLTLKTSDLGDLTPAKFAQTELAFRVGYSGNSAVAIDVALWTVCDDWIRLYNNVGLGEQLVKPLGRRLKQVLNLTRAGHYQLVVRADANGFFSSYSFLKFNLVIPEAPVLALISPLGGLGPLAREYVGGEKLLFSMTDSDSNDTLAIEFRIPGTKGWIREPVIPGYFVEVLIPARAWVGADDAGLIEFRGTDGTYYSEALITVSYSLYNTGAVGLRILTAPDSDVFEGDSATFEFSFVDANSHSLTLSYSRLFGKFLGPRIILLENVAPAPSVYVTVPANAFIYDSKGDRRALRFSLSDGVNESSVVFNYELAGAVTILDTTRGTYFGPLPKEGDAAVTFQYLVRSNDPIIQLKFGFPEQSAKIIWRPWTTVSPGVSAQTITFPYSLWATAPSSPGFHQFVVQAVAAHGSDYLNYTYLAPSNTSPTVQISTIEGEMGRFYVGILPRVSVQVFLTGSEERSYVLVAAIATRFVTVADVLPGRRSIAIPLGFWTTQIMKPGTYLIPFFIGEMKNGRMVDASNLQRLSYTVTDGLAVGDGQLSVLYAGDGDLKVPALSTEVKVPLSIAVKGYYGVGPLSLEYSTVSPPVWTVHPGAIATTRATYVLPRSAFSGTSLTELNVRVARQLVGGAGAKIKLIGNIPPVLKLLRPSGGHLGEIYERPLNDEPPLRALVNLTDDGNNDVLKYSIDDSREIPYESFDGSALIELQFFRGALDLSAASHIVTVKVYDDVEPSLPVYLTYEVIAAPRIEIQLPWEATWGAIKLDSKLPLKLKIQTADNESVTLEYRVEGSPDWDTLELEIPPGTVYKAMISASILTGDAITRGLHYLSLRARTTTQESEIVPVWYSITALPDSPPTVFLGPNQASRITVPSTGPDARQRKVSLIIDDIGNAGILRLDYRAGLTRLTTYGHFPTGPLTVSLPPEMFFVSPINGSSIAVVFTAFDGISGGTSATVTYFVNQPPSFTIDPPGPLAFPATGPAEDLKVRLSITDPDSSDFVVKYRFDDDATWRTSRRVRHQLFTRDALSDYLSFGQVHRLYFLVSDGIENSTNFLEYTVAKPATHVKPTIRLAPHQLYQRFHLHGPLLRERTFNLTLADPDSKVIYVEYSIDGGMVGNARGFPGDGTYAVTIPLGFFTPSLGPGMHRITFRASDGFNSSTAVSNYSVNIPPNLAIVSPTSDVSFRPNTENPLTVELAIVDGEGDLLEIRYKFDSDPLWTLLKSNFSGSALTWNMRPDWTKRYLGVGWHKVRFQADDGFDKSKIVAVSYRVVAFGAPLEDGEEPETVDEDSWVEVSLGTLPGVAIGIGMTIVAVVIAVVIVKRHLRKRAGSTKSVETKVEPIKIP